MMGALIIHMRGDNACAIHRISKSTKTTMPFYKNNEFDYGKVLKFVGQRIRVLCPYGVYASL
jgi:hypothetical protein